MNYWKKVAIFYLSSCSLLSQAASSCLSQSSMDAPASWAQQISLSSCLHTWNVTETSQLFYTFILKTEWICCMKYLTRRLWSGFLFSAFLWQTATTLSIYKHNPFSKIVSWRCWTEKWNTCLAAFPKFSSWVMVNPKPSDNSAWDSWGNISYTIFQYICVHPPFCSHPFLSSKCVFNPLPSLKYEQFQKVAQKRQPHRRVFLAVKVLDPVIFFLTYILKKIKP